MRRIATLAFFVLMVLPTFAQKEGLLSKYEEATKLYDEWKFEEAYKCYDEARPSNTRYPNDISTSKKLDLELSCLKRMGECSYYLLKPKQSIENYNKALYAARKISDKEVYLVLKELKGIYSSLNDRQEIMLLDAMMDSLSRNTNNNDLKFTLLGEMAKQAEEQKDMATAERYYQEREIVANSRTDEKSLENLLETHIDLRYFYLNTGQYDKARAYNKKCIEETSILATKNPDYDNSLNYKEEAMICAKAGMKKEALEALDTFKEILFKDNNPIDTITYHIYTALVYKNLGMQDHSSEEYRFAINGMEEIGDKSDTFYHLIGAYGVSLSIEGKHEQALKYYENYANYVKKAYGYNSEKYAVAMKNLANCNAFCNHLDAARQQYMQCADIMAGIVSKQLKFVSLQQKEAFLNDFLESMRNMTPFALKAGDRQDEFTEKCYDALLFSKALLLESDRTLSEAINLECNSEERGVYQEWLALQQKKTELSRDADNQFLIKLNERISSLNTQLTLIASRLGYTQFLSMKYDDVKATLGNDEILLDFTDFFSDEKVNQHVAYIIDNKQEHPLLLKYATKEDVEKALDGLQIDRLFDDGRVDNARKLLWQPLAPFANGKKTIYYVPSGILHQVALESLPMEDGTLLGEHYKFVRLTSAREIGRYKNNLEVSAKSEALLYGGLKYSLDDATMKLAAAQYDTPPLFAKRGAMRGDSIFYDLPYSLEEVNNAKKILDKRGVPAKVLSGAEGTEESFIALDGKAPQILHLSTHGFYYPKSEVIFTQNHLFFIFLV